MSAAFLEYRRGGSWANRCGARRAERHSTAGPGACARCAPEDGMDADSGPDTAGPGRLARTPPRRRASSAPITCSNCWRRRHGLVYLASSASRWSGAWPSSSSSRDGHPRGAGTLRGGAPGLRSWITPTSPRPGCRPRAGRPAVLRHGIRRRHSHHRILRSPSLRNAERLQIFLRVCAALQHAHQKGIIHRT